MFGREMTDKEFVTSLQTQIACFGIKDEVGQVKCAFCPFKTECLDKSTKA